MSKVKFVICIFVLSLICFVTFFSVQSPEEIEPPMKINVSFTFLNSYGDELPVSLVGEVNKLKK